MMVESSSLSSNEGNVALQAVCKHRSLDMARALVKNGIGNINSLDHPMHGTTPLTKSSKRGHLELVRFLVEEANADIYLAAKRGRTAFSAACEYGHLEVVRYFVETCHVYINKPEYHGETPLMKAIKRGQMNIIKYLVETCRVDLNRVDKFSRNSVGWALQYNHLDIAKYLVKRGGFVNSHNISVNKPLEAACLAGSAHIVDFLFENGTRLARSTGLRLIEKAAIRNHTKVVECLINKYQIDIYNPSLISSLPLLETFCIRGKLKAAACLLASGANIDSRSPRDRYTALHTACSEGNLKAVRFLCEQGADVNAQAGNGQTPLHSVALSGCKGRSMEIAQYLLQEAGADGNVRDLSGFTPLHYAFSRGCMEAIGMCLLETGFVDVNAPRSYPKTTATTYSEERYPVGSTVLHLVCNNLDEFDIETVRYLIAFGANPSVRDVYGETPFYTSIQHSTEVAGVLLEAAGPEILHLPRYRNGSLLYPLPDTPFGDFFGHLYERLLYRPIITHALSKSWLEAAVAYNRDLLKTITSPVTKNLPIHDACVYGAREGAVKVMINEHRDGLRQWNARGRLPFHEACANRKQETLRTVSEILKEHPSALVERDAFGRLPIEIAIMNDAPLDVIYLLLNGLPASLEELIPDCRNL